MSEKKTITSTLSHVTLRTKAHVARSLKEGARGVVLKERRVVLEAR